MIIPQILHENLIPVDRTSLLFNLLEMFLLMSNQFIAAIKAVRSVTTATRVPTVKVFGPVEVALYVAAEVTCTSEGTHTPWVIATRWPLVR